MFGSFNPLTFNLRFHPVTGLPETRLLFEYVDLWSSMTKESEILSSVRTGHMYIPPPNDKDPNYVS